MSRRLLTLLSVLALAMAVLAPAGTAGAAQDDGDLGLGNRAVVESDTGSYIVVMEAAPLLVTEGRDRLNTKAAKAKAKGLIASHDGAVEAAGLAKAKKVNDYTNALNGFSVLASHQEATKLASQDGVAFVLPDVMRYPQTDASPAFLGLTDAGGAYESGLTGEGVVVGVIDSGIWPEHPSFADDGTFSAPPVVLDDSRPTCEFGNTAHNANDAPFECNNKLIGARQMLDTYRALIGATPDEYDSARDDNGHGTHTASTAAGNAGVAASMYGIDRGTVSGIAPRAHVIAYKGLGDLGGFTSDLAASIDQAVADGVDVINYSIGGGAAGPGGDEIAFLFAADAGVHVATSAGNSGPGVATLGNPGTMPWMTTVGASTQSRFFQGTIVLGNGAEYTGASITHGAGPAGLVDAEFAGGDLCVPGSLDPTLVEGNIVLCRRGAIARAGKSLAVSQAGGVGMIMYENSDDNSLFSDTHWVPSVHIDNTPGLEIKAYIASDAAPTAELIGEQYGDWSAAPSMTYFSSRGPNPVAPDIIKPDITAPGIQILAGNTPTPIGGYPGELFQAIAGTSMSSPHVAGLFALMDQAHPDWSPAAVRSALMTTSHQDVVDNDRVSPADPFDMGAGHADPSGNVASLGSMFNPGVVYEAGFDDYLGFLCDAFPEVFSNPAATCGSLAADGVPTEAANLNYPSIGMSDVPGSKTVTRTLTNVSQSALHLEPVIDAPDGFTVDVSPSVLVVPVGRTASYTVTVTNESAPVGEWRFGSLTWVSDTSNAAKKQGISAHSPIAVKGSSISVPSSVSGSGTDGSASFDVQFGYTGDYAAGAHGLVARVDTTDTIYQDPDQTYPSADDGDGVNRHDFAINGAAFVRFSLVIPGDDDIDLFLENSSGTIVAQSTSGGTNELIELLLPADDTYTMVVHGWSVPSEPLEYTLESWIVPLATGGSLSIDSAPTSATVGEVATIDISWSGLTAGTEYLGAVSHSDGGGLLGLTLVEVDTN